MKRETLCSFTGDQLFQDSNLKGHLKFITHPKTKLLKYLDNFISILRPLPLVGLKKSGCNGNQKGLSSVQWPFH